MALSKILRPRGIKRGSDCVQVWKVAADVCVLDAAGNITDAVFLCCLTALMAFKRPDVTVNAGEGGTNGSVIVHPVEEREAVPLSLHQAPLAVTFALFQVGRSNSITLIVPRIINLAFMRCQHFWKVSFYLFS